MKKQITVLCVILALFTCGCASAIKYKLDKSIYLSETPKDLKVFVDLFEDRRPEAEQLGTLDKGAGYLYTSDKIFTPNVPQQISQMIVEHLKKAGIFKEVALQDIPDQLDQNKEEMDRLKAQGIDLVVQGNLTHFYGYQSGASAAAGAFGGLGVLVEAMANPKTVGAETQYSSVKVIDLNHEKILWEGTIDHAFEDKVTLYNGPVAYALESLKKANEKLSIKLNSLVNGL